MHAASFTSLHAATARVQIRFLQAAASLDWRLSSGLPL
jgi:hypothetical protein